jgi:hypothetical protein
MGFIASTIDALGGAIIANVTAGANTTITTSTTTSLKAGDTITIGGLDQQTTNTSFWLALRNAILSINGFSGYANTTAQISVTVGSVISPTQFVLYYDTSSIPGTFTPSADLYVSRDEYYRDNYIAIDLIEMHLKNSAGASDPLYLCGGGFNINYNSPTAPGAGTNTYEAQGEFIGFSTISEDFEIKVGKFSVYLSGVGNNYVNRFTSYSPEGNRVVIYRAFMERTLSGGVEALGIVPDPLILFDGIIYNISITETGSSCQVSVECSTLFSDFDRTSGRKSNNGSNWNFQDGNTYDKSMEQAGFVGQSNFLWGRV